MEKIELPENPGNQKNDEEKKSHISPELDHDTHMVLSKKEKEELVKKNKEADAWREQK